MNSKYKTLIVLAALIAASGAPASTYAMPQQAAAQLPREGEPAQASIPRLIQFNGNLKDAATHPVSGVASVTFAIYAEQDGGSPLWSETQNVLADALGHYNVLLGSATAAGVPSELFGTGQSRWLGVTIARSQEMPRALMASVPYAMKAGDADTLGGLPASAYVTTQSLTSHPLVGASATTIVTSPESALSPGSVIDATPTGTGTANFVPLWTSTSNLGSSKIFQANGGFIGINTTTPLLQLDVNGNSIFRGSFQMAPQGTATASAGQPSHSFQWQGSVFNSSSHAAQNEAFGFRTVPANNNVSNPTAKLDLFYGPGGGTLNDINVSFSNTGRMGIGTTNPRSALEVSSSSPSNIENPSPNLTISNTGNLKDNTGSVSIDFNPFVASTASPEAQIEVQDDGSSSAYMFFNVKQMGSPTNPMTTAFQVNDDGTVAFLTDVSFGSNVEVFGNLTKGSGTFKIDDPIDPANKYLSHSFVESPDMMDMYNGTTTLDAKGEAEVTMPDWFNALNQSFQYQLTAVGGPGPGLYIKEKVHGNQFKIAGGAAGLEVSWQVTGVRHDEWSNAHRTPVEEEKPDAERGTYLHPELFGAGEEKRLAAAKKPSPKKSADPVLAAPSAEVADAAQQPGGKK